MSNESDDVMPSVSGDDKKTLVTFTEDLSEHRKIIATTMARVVKDLVIRTAVHDASKLSAEEMFTYASVTPQFKGLRFGSPEYKKVAAQLGPAWKNHVRNNDHHPEFHQDRGIRGMSLMSLVEMCCDWTAASSRHGKKPVIALGKLSARYKMSNDLIDILANTFRELGIEVEYSPPE